ncbi:restriction endonuclease subunit S [Secundilactobacillus kimchicus]|uniref:restriction endonuclease subunit S n=1 Tax=Secundilactobacillus kimchicus TaxID=528209 RepID=UPI0024A86031|nr:restriction endonuclease subunit S [Secundilactobacillus kimchicus]
METKNVKLGHIAEIKTGPFGSALHNSDYVSNGVPIITVEHIGNLGIVHASDVPRVNADDYERLSAYRLKTGDIVFSRVGAVDRTAIVQDSEDGWLFSGRLLRVRPNPDFVDSGFLNVYFSQSRFRKYMYAIANGSTMPSINTKILASIEVELPSMQFQKVIAWIFRQIDENLRVNQQINSNLLKLSSNIAMAASLKSERITDLQTLLDTSRKANISIDEISLDTYVSNTSLRANKRGLDTAEDYPSVKTVRAVEPGDILVGNIRPYFKTIWFADRTGGASNDVITFRVDNAVVTPEFLFGILYSDLFFDYVTATSKGTKMPRGDKQAIALYQVGLPDKDVIASVTDVVKPMFEQASLNERQNQQLTKLRDLLLPKLLAGDIDLSNIETVMNNA